jgi:hypothetical protein
MTSSFLVFILINVLLNKKRLLILSKIVKIGIIKSYIDKLSTGAHDLNILWKFFDVGPFYV